MKLNPKENKLHKYAIRASLKYQLELAIYIINEYHLYIKTFEYLLRCIWKHMYEKYFAEALQKLAVTGIANRWSTKKILWAAERFDAFFKYCINNKT